MPRRSALALRRPFRSGPSPRLVKAESTIKRLRSRTREQGSVGTQEIITVAAPLIVGMLKSRGTNLPTFGGFNPMLPWGLGLALAGPRLIGGSTGRSIKAAGIGLLAAAAANVGERGELRTEGEVGFEGDDDDD